MTHQAGPSGRPLIDTADFTRVGATLAGAVSVAELVRLVDLLANEEGEIAWTLSGSRRRRADGGADASLALTVRGRVWQRCVRCLEPVCADLDETRVFRIAASEAQAAREDAEDEEFDVLAADARFDVLGLVEDETIMALPIAPRHEDCGLPGGIDPGQPATDGDAKRPNPFEVLRALKVREKS